MSNSNEENDEPITDRDADDWSESMEIDPPGTLDLDGDHEETLETIDDRIAELEEALEDMDVHNPQRGIVNLELGTLQGIRDTLREQEGGS